MVEYLRERDAAVADYIAKAMGGLLIQYALLEFWIDGMVKALWDHVPDARQVRKGGYPFDARSEIEFVCNCLRQIPALSAYQDEGLWIFDSLEPLAEFRNGIVHGCIRELDYESGTIEFSRVVRGGEDKRTPVKRTVTVLAQEIPSITRELAKLMLPAQKLTMSIIQQFVPEEHR